MKHALYIVCLIGTLLIASPFVHGQQGPVVGPGDQGPVVGGGSVMVENPLVADSFIELIETILDIVLIFAVPIIVFFIIYAGFLYVTARGNENTIKQAHMALLYALIGGLLILGARVLIEVVSGTVDAFRD